MNIERYTQNIETCAYLEKKRKEEKKKKQKTKTRASTYIIRGLIKGLLILIYIESFLYFVIVE